MSRYLDCFAQSLYATKYRDSVPLVIDFNRLKNAEYLHWLNYAFSQFLPNSEESFEQLLNLTYSKPTKTLSKGYSFEVDSLWSQANVAFVKPLRLKRLHRQLKAQEQLIQSAFR